MHESVDEGTTAQGVQLFALYTAILFASFAFDVFGVGDGLRDAYIGYDSYIVLNRLKLAVQGVDLFYPPGSYLSQFGLQAALLGGLMDAIRLDPMRFAYWAAYGCALLTAAMLASFLVSVARSFGTLTAHVSTALTALSPTFQIFAPSVYWCTFLLLGPFVATWQLYPRLARTGRGYAWLLVIIATLVAAKCLCGYEYLTTIILSPLVAAVFHQCRTGEPWRRRLPGYVGITSAGVLGFALAMGLHAYQLGHYLHRDGLEVILKRAKARTLEGNPQTEVSVLFGETIFSPLPDAIEYRLNCFFHYFNFAAFNLPRLGEGPAVEISVRNVSLFALGLVLWWLARRMRVSGRYAGLIPALAISSATSLSWQTIASNHMCIHFHINEIVFFIPFFLLAYAAIGCMVQRAADGLRMRAGLEMLALPGWLILVLGCLLVQLNARTGRQVAEYRARQAVMRDLIPNRPVDRTRHMAAIDVPRAQECSVSGDWTYEMQRSDLVRTSTAEPWPPTEVVISGWAFDKEKPTAPKTILINLDGRFIEGKIIHFDRPDVEMALKRRAPNCGFAIFTHQLKLQDIPRARFFVATGKMFNRVSELPPLPPPIP